MKKTISLFLLVFALVFVLSACSSAAKTTATVRWESEEHTFKITKADFTDNNTSSGTTHIKYPIANYESDPSSKDELVPEDVGGTYTMKIVVAESGGTATLTTSQDLYCMYRSSALAEVGVDTSSDEWNRFVVTESPLTARENCVVLFSHTETEVVFLNKPAQTPVSSKNKCDGFYIGKTHIETTHYDLSTDYNTETKQITVSGTRSVDGKTETVNSSQALSSSIIDANQILLYLRSLDKTSDKFQDSPTVSVFSAVANSTYTASFISFAYSCNTYLTSIADDGTQTDIPVKLNMVALSVDGSVLLVQLNLPETVNDNAVLDTLVNPTGDSPDKYTTVRFRSGIINYEKTDISSAILDAVRIDKSSTAE